MTNRLQVAAVVLAVFTLTVMLWGEVARAASGGMLFERRTGNTRLFVYYDRGAIHAARYTTRLLDPKWACTAVDSYHFGPHALPLWIPSMLCATCYGLSVTLAAFQRKRMGSAHCAGCDYDLTGNTSGVCPECGAGVE
jgi:hypothetical protein